ncbi:unnamed protein product [Nezara viridula]|uniref:Uncharacterized protein n=1 Tax=Nezara viridula TaxID=85310 RepID=A0A9P0HSR3_NEZVI|nr:unnamed protein product [Nezara viridula]
MVLDDRRIKVKEKAEVVNMSKERVCDILNQHLDMGKLCARWVPCMFTSIARIIIWQAEGRICGKTATFADKENPVSPRQRTAPQRVPWRKSTIYGLNCFTIRLTHQI